MNVSIFSPKSKLLIFDHNLKFHNPSHTIIAEANENLTFSNNLIHTLDLEITTGGIFPNSVSFLPAGPKTRPSAFLAGN